MSDRFNAAAWLLDRHVEEGRGDRVAIRCQGRSTTYAEVLERARAVQVLLAEHGIAAGDRLAMVVRDDETFPAFFLGALRSGVVPVPLSTMLSGAELAPIVADAGARMLVLSESFAGAADEVRAGAPALEAVVISDEASTSIDAAGAGPAVADTTADSAGFWLYSSGTTGIPKGVMHTHGNLPATVETYASQVLEVEPDDRFASVAKLFFAYGLGNSLTFPFAVGGTTILNPDPPAPGPVAELIASEAPSLFFSSPGFCAALLDSGAPAETFASLRATVTAGESLPANIQTRFAELTGSPVLDGIGSTELLHIFISNTLTEQVPGSTGRLVPGYEAELRNDDDEPITEPDTPGFLFVKGGSAAIGYHERPDATAAAFRDNGWVRTGDVYVRSVEEHWTFLGRNNDMIKAGGIWVSPAEVENVLIGHPEVLEAAVVGSRDDQGLETVVAFVVPTAGTAPTAEDLIAYCRAETASFKRPRRVEVVDSLPKTATGKIRRFQLRQRLENERD